MARRNAFDRLRQDPQQPLTTIPRAQVKKRENRAWDRKHRGNSYFIPAHLQVQAKDMRAAVLALSLTQRPVTLVRVADRSEMTQQPAAAEVHVPVPAPVSGEQIVESVSVAGDAAVKEPAPDPGFSRSASGSRMENLRLVGISWSDSPDALIEDVSRSATVFLKQGQMLEGDILVKEICKNKVILESRGKTIELQ